MDHRTATLIIFQKNLRFGLVKGRIAKSVGKRKALEIFEKLVRKTADNLSNLKLKKVLYYSQEIDSNDYWIKQTISKAVQLNTSDLGDRMKDALSKELHHNKQVVIIGTDCPYIDEEIVIETIAKIQENDIVIGPSLDGGFYLLAIKNEFPMGLFDQIVWSTDQVTSQLEANIQRLGLTYAKLTTLSDVDHIEDWERYISSQS